MNVYDLSHFDPLINEALHRGANMDEIVHVMFVRHEAMMKRLMELESICPKRMKGPDGKIYVWHCPDELIPSTPPEPSSNQTDV